MVPPNYSSPETPPQAPPLAVRLARCLPAELSHSLALKAVRWRFLLGRKTACPPILATTLWGLRFTNPIGLAAGFDKDGIALASLAKSAFGLIETGTITPQPQSGHGRPRLFRLTDDAALINRLGCPSEGIDAVLPRLQKMASKRGEDRAVLGVNIGPNHDRDRADQTRDLVLLYTKIAPYCAYITLNLSSPNTRGLRSLQERPALDDLLAALAAEIAQCRAAGQPTPPLCLKIAPDLDDRALQDLCDCLLSDHNRIVDGLVVANTTIERPSSLRSRHVGEKGGLSGAPLRQPATQLLERLYRLTEGTIPLIGVGGIDSAEAAYERIRHGASLVQLYTALAYHGFGLAARIRDELAVLLQRDGFTSVAEAVGVAIRYPSSTSMPRPMPMTDPPTQSRSHPDGSHSRRDGSDRRRNSRPPIAASI